MTPIDYPHGEKATWTELAQDIVDGHIEVSLADMPALLGWLRDMNWPGARIVANHLPKHPTAIASAVGEVLRGDDDVWKYWVLTALVRRFDRECTAGLAEELLATAMTDDAEECAAAALMICAANQIGTKQQLAHRLQALIRLGTVDEGDAASIADQLEQFS